MRSDHIMGCCGAIGIWDFPYIRGFDPPDEVSRKKMVLKKYLERRLQRAKAGQEITGAFFVAILADYQLKGLEGVFEDFGFILHHQRKNPNSHNMIYIYTKDI